ncbi:MAG: J domain-containing protein [Acidobacteria bacterium]|nr:MAG: J domain-containing protein [Acidobacteriota bacterium]
MNYYKVLGISPRASASEIKRAYRRLAKQYHPDLHGGSEEATKRFALIAEAYEILSDPQKRKDFDRQLAQSANGEDSILFSDNYYARKLRQIALERRYNQIVDRIIEAEREEVIALQKVIFPLVALFLSIFFVAIFRPRFFANAEFFGKMALITLSVIGFIHLISRLREGFQKYTYDSEKLHNSIFEEEEEKRPYSRSVAFAFLIFGIGISLGLGWIIGNYLEMFVAAAMPRLFSPTFQTEFILYPPILVLLIDIIHYLTSKD